jgi:hypothetical protein
MMLHAAPYDDPADWPNPYDFVPFEDGPTLLADAPGHDRSTGRTGRIAFTLEPLTPLSIQHDPADPACLNGQRPCRFARRDGAPVVPATSLKGMLRSVHEVATNSAMAVISDAYRPYVPQAYLPSSHGDHLTPSEALFGLVGAQGETEDNARAGRVWFDDLPVAHPLVPEEVSRPRGGQPKPLQHRSFYFGPANQALGRKFYYHHDPRRVVGVYRDRGMPEITVETVQRPLAGSLRFTNLTDDELGTLVYALALEDGLAHKLGYAKPLGFGSVRLLITRLEVERFQDGVPARFLSYGDEASEPEDWTDRWQTLRDAVKAEWLARPRGRHSHGAFAAILRWQDTRSYAYPSFAFFRRERGTPQQKTLCQYQRRSTVYPGAPPEPATTPPPRPAPVRPGPPVDLRLVARLQDDETYGPYVLHRDEKKYRLDEQSAPPETLAVLRARLAAKEQPAIRYAAARIKEGKKGPPKNVLRDVELVDEGS